SAVFADPRAGSSRTLARVTQFHGCSRGGRPLSAPGVIASRAQARPMHASEFKPPTGGHVTFANSLPAHRATEPKRGRDRTRSGRAWQSAKPAVGGAITE